MSKQRRTLLGYLLLLRGLMVLAVFATALVASLQRPARAEESFPWCVQGETLQCYYPTRDQLPRLLCRKSLCAAAASAAQLCPINPSALGPKN
jgi:hypothetical protein